MTMKLSHVLIADDDRTARVLMQTVLEKQGFKVTAVKDGESALAVLGDGIDLVLLDIGMPGISGFEVCQIIRQDFGAEIPVVMVTGHDDVASIEYAYEIGATDFIAKPINWTLFGHRVRYILRASRTLQSLHLAEAKNRALLRVLPDLIVRVNASGDILEWHGASLAGVKFDGHLNLARLLLKNGAINCLETLERTIREMLQWVVEERTNTECELSWNDAEGEPVVFDMRAVPEFDHSGKVASVLTIARDVTARCRMEKALRRSHEMLEQAQRIGHVGHWELDLASGRLEWSEEVCHIFEIDRATFGANYEAFLAIVHPNDRERVDLFYRKSLENKTPSYIIDYLLLLPDGRIKYISGRCENWFDETGQPLRSMGTVQDITALKEAEDRLRESHELLKELTIHREAMREAERKRVAWEMHEELGQYLAAIRMGLTRVRGGIAGQNQQLNGESYSLVGLLDRTIHIVREVVEELRPPVLDLGLSSALDWLANDFTRRTGLPCDLYDDSEEVQLDEAHTLALFRVAEEALGNVARHAEAKRVELSLIQEEEECVLTVHDDGKGFDPMTTTHKHFGLLGIQTRLAAFGGEVRTTPASGGGTVLTARLPVGRNNKISMDSLPRRKVGTKNRLEAVL
ncbi:putative PAS domain S-box-containing protein [Gammaproteobacteria bacterium]